MPARELVRSRRVGPLVAGAVGVVLALLVFVLATREPALNRRAKSPLLGKAAPSITGTTIDGQAFDLAALRGRFVVVNFFASWCVPCQQEHPDLVAFSERHRERNDAVVVSVVFNDTAEQARQFFATRGGQWPVVAGNTAKFAVAYGAIAPPETFLVDPNGIVFGKFIGRVTAAGLEKALAGVT